LKIKKDLSKPDGTPRKIVDTTIAKRYGWKPKVSFSRGLTLTLSDYLRKK